MSYKQRVIDLQDEYKKEVISFMENNKLDEISFKNPFKVVVSIMWDYNDFGYENRIVNSLLSDGTVVSNDEELIIGELDIYDIAHILDILNKGEYKVVTTLIDH